jgi:hypothetical protein
MNPRKFRVLLFAAACAAALSACQRDDEMQVSNGQPVPGSVPVRIEVGSTKDPSLPDASVVAAQLAADKAREEALAQSSALSTQAQEPSKVN